MYRIRYVSSCPEGVIALERTRPALATLLDPLISRRLPHRKYWQSEQSVNAESIVRRQSAYVGTVIWNRQVRGLCTAEEKQSQLELLATSG
ncbi:MAG: hypothetical protein IIC90_04910 [Chloroflexi bacterium]|nr:hypothetical protein [Chloroflexota bacterium]